MLLIKPLIPKAAKRYLKCYLSAILHVAQLYALPANRPDHCTISASLLGSIIQTNVTKSAFSSTLAQSDRSSECKKNQAVTECKRPEKGQSKEFKSFDMTRAFDIYKIIFLKFIVSPHLIFYPPFLNKHGIMTIKKNHTSKLRYQFRRSATV